MNFELARGVAIWTLHAAGAVLEPHALPHLIEGHIAGRRFRVTILQKSTLAHVKFLEEDERLLTFPDTWNIVVFPSTSIPTGAGAAIERLGMVPTDPYMLADVLRLGDWTPSETPPPLAPAPSRSGRKK